MAAGAAWAGAKGPEKGNEILKEHDRKKRIEEIQKQHQSKTPQQNHEKKTPGNMQKSKE